MGPFRAYYWLVLKTAWRHSPDLAQAILFFALIIIGFVVWLVPQVAPMMPDVSGWQAAAGVLAAIVAARILLAPYWLDRDKDLELETMKARAGETKPDLTQWPERVDPLEIGQAAALWCGFEPTGKMHKLPGVSIRIEILKRAVLLGELTPDFPPNQLTLFKMQRKSAFIFAGAKGDIQVTDRTPIRVRELMRYADSKRGAPGLPFR